jgi:hypothetical protein
LIQRERSRIIREMHNSNLNCDIGYSNGGVF